MRSTFLLFLFLLAPIRASTIVYTSDGPTVPAFFEQFDPALGELTGMSFGFVGQATAQITATNTTDVDLAAYTFQPGRPYVSSSLPLSLSIFSGIDGPSGLIPANSSIVAQASIANFWANMALASGFAPYTGTGTWTHDTQVVIGKPITASMDCVNTTTWNGQTFCSPAWGIVTDMALSTRYWSRLEYYYTPTVVPNPEPGYIGALAMGLVAVFFIRRALGRREP